MAANNDNESITTCETHLNAQKDELGKDDEANQQEEPLDDSRFDNDEDEDEDEVSLESTCGTFPYFLFFFYFEKLFLPTFHLVFHMKTIETVL